MKQLMDSGRSSDLLRRLQPSRFLGSGMESKQHFKGAYSYGDSAGLSPASLFIPPKGGNQNLKSKLEAEDEGVVFYYARPVEKKMSKVLQAEKKFCSVVVLTGNRTFVLCSFALPCKRKEAERWRSASLRTSTAVFNRTKKVNTNRLALYGFFASSHKPNKLPSVSLKYA